MYLMGDLRTCVPIPYAALSQGARTRDMAIREASPLGHDATLPAGGDRRAPWACREADPSKLPKPRFLDGTCHHSRRTEKAYVPRPPSHCHETLSGALDVETSFLHSQLALVDPGPQFPSDGLQGGRRRGASGPGQPATTENQRAGRGLPLCGIPRPPDAAIGVRTTGG
jgi:hypothetical protein